MLTVIYANFPQLETEIITSFFILLQVVEWKPLLVFLHYGTVKLLTQEQL